MLLIAPGCNATSPVQIPGQSDFFINRQMLTSDGQIAGVSAPNDCSGGNQENEKYGRVYNRWALTLNRLDWTSHKLIIVKTLLDTSIDPRTSRSRTKITGGPMPGAFIRSAYDADIVFYRGMYLVVFECTIDNDAQFGVYRTSSCISVYDQSKQSLDLSRTQVIISGIRTSNGVSYAATVPELLVYRDKLYLYWSTTKLGKYRGVAVRGAELEVSASGGISVKGSHGNLVYASDPVLSTEVWSPDPGNQMGNSRIDLGPLWKSGPLVIATGSKGGGNCTGPSDTTPGCYRLTIVKSDVPLGKHVFNHAQPANESLLPTNPQEYTRPVRDPSGEYWLCGHYVKPRNDGFSELRPAPGGNFWKDSKRESALIMFPLTDKAIWPTE